MGTTGTYALRYPESTDTPDLPTQLHNLATDTETAFATVQPDSGVLTTLAITPATGWSLTASKYRTIGKKMWVLMQFSRTGAAITATAAGNLSPDVQVATITDAAHRPVLDWYGEFRAAVTGGSVQISASTGVVTIVDAHSTSIISTGDGINIYAAYSNP